MDSEVEEPKKRGPKTGIADEALVAEIRKVLGESDFLGEGHRRVRARLRSCPGSAIPWGHRLSLDWRGGGGGTRFRVG